MNSNRRLSSNKTIHYFSILFAMSSISISTFIALKIAQETHGQTFFEQFALILRYSSFLAIMGCLGLGVTITRKVSEIRANQCEDNLSALIATSVITVVGLFLVLTCVAIALPNLTEMGTGIVLTLLAYSFSLVIFNVAYSIERGFSNFLPTELSRALYINLPIVPLAYFAGAIEIVFWVATLLNLSWSILFLIPRFRLTTWFTTDLLVSSFKRFPADFIIPLVWLVPVGYANVVIGTQAAANLSIVFSVVTASLTLFGPISTMVLSDASRIQASTGTRNYARRMTMLLTACLPLFALMHYGVSIVFGFEIDAVKVLLLSLLSLSYGATTIFRGLAEGLYDYGRFSIILFAIGSGTFLVSALVQVFGELSTNFLIATLILFFTAVNAVLYRSFGRLV